MNTVFAMIVAMVTNISIHEVCRDFVNKLFVSRVWRKSFILEVPLGFKYTLSTELFLDRFGQSNKFRKKSKRKFKDIQQMTPHLPQDVFRRSLKGSPEKVLGTSQIGLPGTTFGLEVRTSLGYQIGTSPRRSNRIFKGCPCDECEGRPWNVLATNICRLGNSL